MCDLALNAGLTLIGSGLIAASALAIATWTYFPSPTSAAGSMPWTMFPPSLAYVCGTLGGVPVVCMKGRSHFYEGKGADGLILLETNTQPGMTPTSLAPEQAAHVGIDFPALCRWLVEDATCNR